MKAEGIKRFAYFVFGLGSHGMFLAVFLYFAGFVGNLLVPKSIDSPAGDLPPGAAAAVDVLLLALFAVPHSVMARPAFKRWWTQFVPKPLERSVYVLIANLCVMLLMWQWRPIGPNLWDVQHPLGRALAYGLFAAGWLLVPLVSLLINHFDLFGTRQVWLHLKRRPYTPPPFRVPLLYRLVRHPLYVGWIVSFWATPTMSAGHVLFAGVLTAYMLVAIPIEERDLVDLYGERYEQYRRTVPALLPRPGRRFAAGGGAIGAGAVSGGADRIRADHDQMIPAKV
jgi:protein-S-isoprenylcysteine O-methyltransferase Ste14